MSTSSTKDPLPQEHLAGKSLAQALLEHLRDQDGRNRAEDLISATASILGERCIHAAGEIDPRRHSLTPGERIFSERINLILTGEKTSSDWKAIPTSSVCGHLRIILTSNSKYATSDFPDMTEIYAFFAANIGDKGSWGHAPLSIPREHFPRILPLRLNFETRGLVDNIFELLGKDTLRHVRAATFSLATVLIWISESLDKSISLRLALETINGMAKTVPMTAEALNKISKK